MIIISTTNFTSPGQVIKSNKVNILRCLFNGREWPWLCSCTGTRIFSPWKSGRKDGCLAGFLYGPLIHDMAITVGHLVEEEGDLLFMNVDICIGHCVKKFQREVIVNQYGVYSMVTADIALLKIIPGPGVSVTEYFSIPNDSRHYRMRLYDRGFDRISPRTVLWMVNSYGDVVVGVVLNTFKLLRIDKCQLYYVITVQSATTRQAISNDGDSGSAIFFPPHPDSHEVVVVGMVYGRLRLPGEESATVAMFLPDVVRNIYSDPRYKHEGSELFKHDISRMPCNLKHNVDMFRIRNQQAHAVGGKVQVQTEIPSETASPFSQSVSDSGIAQSHQQARL